MRGPAANPGGLPIGRAVLTVVLVFFGAILALGSCTTANLTTQQTLFDTQTRYTELGAVAARYVSLPLCEPVPLVRCAEEGVVRAIQQADKEIYFVLQAAEAARGTLDEDQYRALAAAALSRLRIVIVESAVRETLQ